MIDKIKNDEWLESYSKLGEAAHFFLSDAFYHIHQEFEYQLASKIFNEKIKGVEPTDADKKIIAKSISIPDNTIDLLKFDGDVLTNHIQERHGNAWTEAQNEAKNQKYKFNLKYQLGGTSLLGHFTNFGLFFEVLLNRHFLYLKIADFITSETYKTMDRSPVMTKLNFAFKDEINAKVFKVGYVSNLFKFRNLSVHYTAANSQKLKIKFDQILAIWKETKLIVEKMHEIEQKIESSFSDEIEQKMTQVKKRWQQVALSAYNNSSCCTTL